MNIKKKRTFVRKFKYKEMRTSSKDYLYQAIFKLFLSKHYELVTIKDIELATGMTRGAVFYYAKNKAELFCEIVENYFFKAQDIDDKLNSIQKSANSFLEFIHLYVQVIDTRMKLLQKMLNMERNEASRAYLAFILQAQTYYPNFNEKITAINDKELATWINMLSLAKKTNEIKSNIDIDVVARFFRYFYIGQCYQSSLSTTGMNIAELEFYFMTIYSMIKN